MFTTSQTIFIRTNINSELVMLTARTVQTAKGVPGKAVMLGDGHCLYLRIGPTGAKSWIFRYTVAGKAHEKGLGPIHTVSLAEAREAARELRRGRREGKDPKRAGMSFRECAEAYIASHEAGWRNAKHAAQWANSLATHAYPVLGRLPVAAIGTEQVLKAIGTIWREKPETASRVRGRIESVLDWAAVAGYRNGDNPARWRGHLSHMLPARARFARGEHFAALPYAGIADFMTKLRQQGGVAARALEFAILTAARTGEVSGARWPEIDLAGRLWVIPADRIKMGREHRVPLSSRALSILSDLERRGERVFPISATSLRRVLSRIGRQDVTVHGFRSTFSTWAAEQTNFSEAVVEAALAHAKGDKVAAAYNRSDLFEKRRELADAWARYCGGGGKVVQLREVG
jgi:integrase